MFMERRIRVGKGLQDIRLKGHTILSGKPRLAPGLDYLIGSSNMAFVVGGVS